MVQRTEKNILLMVTATMMDAFIVSKKCGPVNIAVMLHDSAASSDIRSEK